MTYVSGYYKCNVCGAVLTLKELRRIIAEKKVDYFGMPQGKQWDLCDEHFNQALKRLNFTLK